MITYSFLTVANTMTKSKEENLGITAENLRRVAGLNGYTVTELARIRGCSDALLYRSAADPKSYPAVYRWLDATLPRRNP